MKISREIHAEDKECLSWHLYLMLKGAILRFRSQGGCAPCRIQRGPDCPFLAAESYNSSLGDLHDKAGCVPCGIQGFVDEADLREYAQQHGLPTEYIPAFMEAALRGGHQQLGSVPFPF